MANDEAVEYSSDDAIVADILEPVEGKEPEARDELISELLPKLSLAKQEVLYNLIYTDHLGAVQDRSEWEARLADDENQYFGVLPEKNFPWPGSSNLHVPLTMLGIETLKPRLVESILGMTPPVMAVPTEYTDAERQEKSELFLNWQILNELKVEPLVVESAHTFLLPGTVVAKIVWEVDRRKKCYVRSFGPETKTDDVFRALFGQKILPKLEQIGELEWEGAIPSNPLGGPECEIHLKMVTQSRELQVLVEQEEITEKPRITILDTTDFFVPARSGADVQRMPWCQERLYFSEDELRRQVKLGILDKDAVEELIRGSGPTGPGLEAQEGNYEYQATRDAVEGVEGEGQTDVRLDRYEVILDYRRWDMDDDGFEENVITTISPGLSGRVLGWDYLENVYAHGLRPYMVGRYLPIAKRFYGLSFPETIRNIQEEINTIHNQRVDSGTLQNTPWFFFRSSSQYAPIKYSIRPGEGIPIDNPAQDILIPRFSGNSAFGQAEEALLYQYFERLTGLTDLALGRQPNRVGATRTATGVASLLSEAGLRFKTSMKAFQAFWIGIFEHVLALDAQYLPSGKEFRVTGKLPEVLKILDRTELAGRYDIRLAATTETMNRSIMREDAAIILQSIMQPLVLQSGLLGLRGVNRAYRDFLRSFGKDPDAYLEPIPNGVPRTPDEELVIWSEGGEANPNPMENLVVHVATHEMQLRDPKAQSVLGPAGMKKLHAHLLATVQLLQTQQMSAQMQAGSQGGQGAVGQQAMNAQVGRTAPQQPTTRMMMQPEQMTQGGP